MSTFMCAKSYNDTRSFLKNSSQGLLEKRECIYTLAIGMLQF